MSQNTLCCTRTLILGLLTAIIWADLSSGQLVINVKNQVTWKKVTTCYIFIYYSIFLFEQGGDILQENLTSNVTDDTVQLEFQKADGTYVPRTCTF